ncbi:MAG TPA: Spy/CpxP family protein refolding chaperone [Pyrinomonadaceae bacterium]|nr:Spy/CpxP family protein refolding chaperone [Pyrinomonadaceae bacterium]
MKLVNSRKPGAAWPLALFLLLLIFAPAQAFAQEGPGASQSQTDARPPNPDGDLVRQLNLTPDQIEKIKAIREGNREIRRQIGQRIRAARIALDSAIYVENADETVVEQRARELAEAQAAQVRLQAMTELGIRRILTLEQLQTFRALRLRAESERRNRRLQENGNALPLRNRGQNATGPADAGRPLRQRRGRP